MPEYKVYSLLFVWWLPVLVGLVFVALGSVIFFKVHSLAYRIVGILASLLGGLIILVGIWAKLLSNKL